MMQALFPPKLGKFVLGYTVSYPTLHPNEFIEIIVAFISLQ